MSLEVCKNCGGLFVTEFGESFGGTPCVCGSREPTPGLMGKERLTQRETQISDENTSLRERVRELEETIDHWSRKYYQLKTDTEDLRLLVRASLCTVPVKEHIPQLTPELRAALKSAIG